MRRSIVAAGAIGLSLALAACANKEAVKISVKPSDLRDEAAVSALYAEIESAAAGLCAKADGNAVVTPKAASACEHETVRQAVDRAGLAPLTAYYEGAEQRNQVPPVVVQVASR
jgi:UrcA family protein